MHGHTNAHTFSAHPSVPRLRRFDVPAPMSAPATSATEFLNAPAPAPCLTRIVFGLDVDARRASHAVPRLHGLEVGVVGVRHGGQKVVAGDGVAVVALEVEVHAFPEALLAEQRFVHAHHLSALLVHCDRVEVVHLDVPAAAAAAALAPGLAGPRWWSVCVCVCVCVCWEEVRGLCLPGAAAAAAAAARVPTGQGLAASYCACRFAVAGWAHAGQRLRGALNWVPTSPLTCPAG
eukprot:365743-Chlamydomonas_euryale.AAC.38